MSLRSVLRTVVATMFVPCIFAGAQAQMPNPLRLEHQLGECQKSHTAGTCRGN
jgi:hypothetical protein